MSSSTHPTNSTTALHDAAGQIVRYRGIVNQPTSRTPQCRLGESVMTLGYAWNRFMAAVGRTTHLKTVPVCHDEAWDKHFRPVLAHGYSDAREFSNALFDALRGSLKAYCEASEPQGAGKRQEHETSYDQEIRLKNSNVAFATGVYGNANLGFPKSDCMPISVDSMVDHACVILRRDGEEGVMLPARKKKRIGLSVAASGDAEQFFYDDVTAAVVLRYGTAGCKQDANAIDLQSSYGQAILYAMVIWNCLARRGHRVGSIPFFVWAGQRPKLGLLKRLRRWLRSKWKKIDHEGEDALHPKQRSKGTDMKDVCCAAGALYIPEELGSEFWFQIDHCTAQCSTDAVQQALAIYLNTMALGLDRANFINKRGIVAMTVPNSLCCWEPLPQLRLIASPIPNANPKSNLAISQGELYRFEDPTSRVLVTDWISKRPGQICCLAGPCDKMEACLVKVSHKTVHDTFVPIEECWRALCTFGAQKKAIGDVALVLLAFAYVHPTSLCTVMTDLSSTEFNYRIVSRDALSSCVDLFDGFGSLTQDVLLPMANLNVVHTDIRCYPNATPGLGIVYNILGRTVSGKSVFELRLIDYESLVLFNSYSFFGAKQDYAVSTGHFPFGSSARNAHNFLFWQVLWMAYTIYENDRCVRMATEDAPAITVPGFIQGLFDRDSRLEKFRVWLGPRSVMLLKATAELLQNLGKSSASKRDAARDAVFAIKKSLEIVREVFVRNESA